MMVFTCLFGPERKLRFGSFSSRFARPGHHLSIGFIYFNLAARKMGDTAFLDQWHPENYRQVARELV